MTELLASLGGLLALLGQLVGGPVAAPAAPTVVPREIVASTTRADFLPLLPMRMGSTTLEASVADTFAERAQGLSGTTQLPPGIAKVFRFEYAAAWSFWMKDMRYAIDIVWVSAAGEVVHIVAGATPESYPQSFVPAVPAQYVVEVPAGFMAAHGYGVGTSVTLPDVQTPTF